MKRLIFAVIMFAIAIGIVACGRANQNIETRQSEAYSVNENIEL